MSKHVLNTRLSPTASLTGGRHAELSGQGGRHNPPAPVGALHAFAAGVSGAMKAGAFSEGASPDDRLGGWDEETLLAELYRSESPKLVRILSRRTGNGEDAQDLVQDIFFRFARMRGRWPSSLERPQAYLRRIAANLLKDRAKADFRHSAGLHVMADEELLPGLDQHGLLESRDMLRRVEAAMMRLRPKTREIFMAHRIHGMSYAEIADQTGLSVRGVEKQMSKALVQLDRILNRL